MNILNMRLPTCAEYNALVEAADGDNAIIHWKGMGSWCQDEDPEWASGRAVRGWVSARHWVSSLASYQYVHVGFRPTFEALAPDAPDSGGAVIVIGTLYMAGQPVKVPQNPTWDGDIPDYIPGAKLELREALEDPAYQVQAIRVGSVLIADRVLLKNISWDDIQEVPSSKLMNMRLSTCAEWVALAEATGGENSIMHWEEMYSWCQDAATNNPSHYMALGYFSAHIWGHYDATGRHTYVGFRPTFETLAPDAPDSDGAAVVVGTLYMDGQPVKVPQNPTWDGDIPDYISGAKLELRETLEDPAYQVQAIRVGSVLIADRVLLKNISWDDIQEALSSKESVENASRCGAQDALGSEETGRTPKPAVLVLNGMEYSFKEIAEKLGLPGSIFSVEIRF